MAYLIFFKKAKIISIKGKRIKKSNILSIIFYCTRTYDKTEMAF